MNLKLKVFSQMIVGLILMILTLFTSLIVTYEQSYSLIDELSNSMYQHQQKQLSALLSLHSFEFNYVFQRFSESLQAINHFQQRIVGGNVNLAQKFNKLIGNREKVFRGTEFPPIQSIFNKNIDMIDLWFDKDTLEFSELDQQIQIQFNNSYYSNFMQRVIKNSNNYNNQDLNKIKISDIVEGHSYSGSIIISGLNSSIASYKPPSGCPYSGKYVYDSRCRKWFLQASKQNRVTPIEPMLVFGETPFLAGILCKNQRKKKDVNGKIVETNCTSSVNCLSFQLTAIKNYFASTNYNFSTTVMIDPRSEIIVFNQLSNITLNITRLINATIQIFPNDTQTQNEFLEQIRSRKQRKKNLLYDDQEYQFERMNLDETNECEVNPFKIEQLIKILPVNFGDYSFKVPKIHLSEEQTTNYQSSSFILRPGEKEEVFIDLNFISIIEKLKEKNNQKSYEIQDLFIVIDVLPKHSLTNQTDKLKMKINFFIMWVSIASLILCGLLIIIAGVISYKVAVMIEKPLIHMTNILNKLDKEGGTAAIDSINSQSNEYDTIFLSKDSQILFNSFKEICQMLQIATEDIFTVEDSCSLLRLNYQINFFKEFKNIRVLGICYNNMGNIHFQNGRYLESMEAYQSAIILAQQEAEFYLEQQEDQRDSSPDQPQFLERDMSEYRREEQKLNLNQKQGILSSIYSKIKTISISLMVKRVSEFNRNSINQNQFTTNSFHDLQINPKSSFQNTSEAVKEIIFDRRLNFSNAFYMHNISQETGGMTVNGNRIINKILNNPINFQGNLIDISQTKIIFDWENYEDILLDLLKLNSELKTHSFGRTIILLTQLSLCHLKMGKIDQASDDQSLAIDHYQCLMTQKFNKITNHSDLTNTNSNLKSQIDQLKLNINQSIIHSKLQFPEMDQSNLIIPQRSSRFNSYKISMPYVDDSIFRKSETLTFQLDQDEIRQNEISFEYEEDLSLKNMLKKRQKAAINKFEQNKIIVNNLSDPFNNLFKSINQKLFLLKDLSKNVIEDHIEGNQQNEMQNSKQKSMKNSISNHEKNFQVSEKKKDRFFELMNNRHNTFSSERRPSTPKNKLLSSNKNKRKTLSQMKSQFSTHIRQLKQKQLLEGQLRTKTNKQFQQDDLLQQQRYELPGDILLYLITLQESRLLFYENNEIFAAFTLTNLLEITKCYLPYYRLACLNMLNDIINSKSKVECSINKMIKRFDVNIQFNASIAVVVKHCKEKAIQTIINLINDVFTNDQDIISLLLHQQNNFQQIIPSIQLKQLRLTSGFFESFLESIYQSSNNSQMQFPISTLNETFSSINQQSFQNQKLQPAINRENNNISDEKKQKLLQVNQYQDYQKADNSYFPLKKIDFSDSQTRRSSFSSDLLEKNQIIQKIPKLKDTNMIQELKKSIIREERKSQFQQRFLSYQKNQNQISDLSSQPLSLEETKTPKYSSPFQQEENFDYSSNERGMKSSRINLLQSKRKESDSTYGTQIDLLITSPHLNSESADDIKNSNKIMIQSEKKTQNLNKIPYNIHMKNRNKQNSENNSFFQENENDSIFKMNLIFHLTIRKCIKNFFLQNSNNYEMHQMLFKKDIFSKQKKFVIFITDQFGIIVNQAYTMLSNLLYSTQTLLLILLLNKEEQLLENSSFKNVQINGKSVIKFFYSKENLLQYIKNKREPMKNFGVPFLVEHLNM